MKKRAKWISGLILCVVLGSGGWLALRASEPLKTNGGVRVFMRVKLDASTKILEGLTTENFQMISDGAQTFQHLSGAEKWRVSNDPLYMQYSAEFRQHADKLREKAHARNLDGATLAWMECTMSCVRCHSHARAIRIAGR